MKKILYLLAIPAAAVALSTSCSNLNTFPVFDDANAFVSFGETTASIAEDQGIIEIPVVLSSVKGISTSITFDVVDSTAKAGVDFVMPENKTLTFDSENRTQNIRIQIIDRDGDYTGDLVFKLVFNSTGSVTDGAANECIITITDLDHPLSTILGTYTAQDALGISWPITLTSDESDDTMVWIQDIAGFASGGWPLDQTMYYGVVDHTTMAITIPVGQESVYTRDVDENGIPEAITLCVVTPDGGIYDEGFSITGTTTENGARIEMNCEGCTSMLPGFIAGETIYTIGVQPFFPIILTK